MTWLESKVRQAKLLQVLLCVAVVIVTAWLLGLNKRYFANYFAGPYDITAAELAAAPSADALPRYWVNVSPSRLVDSGVDHVTVHTRKGVETSRSVTGHYWFALVGDKLLVVKAVAAPAAGVPIRGSLVRLASSLDSHLFASITPKAKAGVLPMMLDTEDFQASGTIGLMLAALVAGVALVWALMSLRLAFNPRRHRAIAGLAALGTLEDVSRSIKSALDAGETFKFGKYRLTRDYLVKTGLRFDLRPTSELLWAYTVTTTTKAYGLITTGRTYQVALHFTKGKVTEKINAKAAEQIMPVLAQMAPWTLLGHSPEIERAVKINRAAVAANVADRRRTVLDHWAAQPPFATAATA